MDLNRRQAMRCLTGLATWPIAASHVGAARAQPNRPIAVGVLISGTPDRWALISKAIRDGLAEQGYVDGKNLKLHLRTATYPDRRMNMNVDELVAKKLDVIVTACGWSTSLAAKATQTTPIVMATIADPVGRGYVKSLARPGTNVTGMTGQIANLAPKMLEYISVTVARAWTPSWCFPTTISSSSTSLESSGPPTSCVCQLCSRNANSCGKARS